MSEADKSTEPTKKETLGARVESFAKEIGVDVEEAWEAFVHFIEGNPHKLKKEDASVEAVTQEPSGSAPSVPETAADPAATAAQAATEPPLAAAAPVPEPESAAEPVNATVAVPSAAS